MSVCGSETEAIEEIEDGSVQDDIDNSFLEVEDEMKCLDLKIIEGDKDGSKWLLVDDIFICHQYQRSEKQIFWECSGRKKLNCPFKIGTYEDESGQIKASYAYKASCHDCRQGKVGPILHIFRSTIKKRMQENYKAKFHTIFNEEKKILVDKYKDDKDLLERIIYELKDKRSYRDAANRARQKIFPKNPQCH